MKNLIAEQLEQSKQWRSHNRDSMALHRWEGTLTEAIFNQQLLQHLSPYDHFYRKLQNSYACGFEIEFYLQPEKMEALEKAIAARLPESQMLLIDLNQPIKSNGRNFYLMAENTGQPPEGLQSYELVSPILDPKTLPYFLHRLLECLHDFDAKDNEHLGFHLHLSTQCQDSTSPIALLFFLDKAGCFDWPSRQFTRNLVAQFFDYQPQDWQLIFEEITRKCYNLNLLHYAENNHIELRSVGGQGYLQDPQKIIETSLNALKSFEKAAKTPMLEIAHEIAQHYSLHKQVQPLNQIDYQNLLTQCDAAKANQLWLAHIPSRNQKNN